MAVKQKPVSVSLYDPRGELRDEIEAAMNDGEGLTGFIRLAVEDLIEERKRAKAQHEREKAGEVQRQVVSGVVNDDAINDFLSRRAMKAAKDILAGSPA